MTNSRRGQGAARNSRSRMLQQREHDTYKRRSKSKEAMVCDECRVVWHAGKWYWGAPPLGNQRGGLCPACERIRDHYPAGTVRLHRGFAPRRDEILGMIRNLERAEKAEHPLERILSVDESEGEIVVTTTGLHLARRIASALKRQFHKNVVVRYPPEEHMIYVDCTF